MTYELIIKANTKEELLALLQGASYSDVPTEAVPLEEIPVKVMIGPKAEAPAPTPQVAPQAPTVTAPVTPSVTAPAQPSYTVEDLVRAAAPLMDDPEGVRMLQELLASFGAASLVELDKAKLAEFATGLRSLGVEV